MQKIKSEVNYKLIVCPDKATHEKNDDQVEIRASLHVAWDREKDRRKVVAIGINPSTAHNGKSDNTITRLCRLLDMYGYNDLNMLNLFESSSPQQNDIDKRTETDFETKRDYFEDADIILIVWGMDEKIYFEQISKAKVVLSDYKEKLYCIQKNFHGVKRMPCHPSRISYGNVEIGRYAI